MREWTLNSKNKNIYSCLCMTNTLRIKIWILKNREKWTLYLGGLWCIYNLQTLSCCINGGAGVSFLPDSINKE
jgi:hypothetical protein